MSTMADIIAAHWSRSTHSDSEPFVDKCDGCGAVIYTWGGDPTPDGIEPLATHQAEELAAAGYGDQHQAWEAGHTHCFHVENPHNKERNPYPKGRS